MEILNSLTIYASKPGLQANSRPNRKMGTIMCSTSRCCDPAEMLGMRFPQSGSETVKANGEGDASPFLTTVTKFSIETFFIQRTPRGICFLTGRRWTISEADHDCCR